MYIEVGLADKKVVLMFFTAFMNKFVGLRRIFFFLSSPSRVNIVALVMLAFISFPDSLLVQFIPSKLSVRLASGDENELTSCPNWISIFFGLSDDGDDDETFSEDTALLTGDRRKCRVVN